MTFLRYEIANPVSFDAGEQILPKNCRYIRLRHIAGVGNAQITFAAGGATAQVILSPAGGAYPQEVQMETSESFERVRILGAASTTEVTAWT